MSFCMSPVLCSKCKDAMAIMTCHGCGDKLCHKDYLEHYQKLSDDVEKLEESCQAFAETLDSVEPPRKAMAHIDEWEQKSYQIIAEAAARARADVRKLLEPTKKDIETGTVNMKTEIETKWTKKKFSEIDIKLWNQKLEQMKTQQREEFVVIEVSDDNQYKPLHMIKVVNKDILSQLLCESEIDKISDHVKYNPVSGFEKIVKNGSSRRIQTQHHNICAMDYYEKVSMEELRFKYYSEISPPRESIQFVSLLSKMSILSDRNSDGSTASTNDRSSSIFSLIPPTNSSSAFSFGGKPSTNSSSAFSFGVTPPAKDQPSLHFGTKPPTNDQPSFTVETKPSTNSPFVFSFGAKPSTNSSSAFSFGATQSTNGQRLFVFGETPSTTSTGQSTTSNSPFNFGTYK